MRRTFAGISLFGRRSEIQKPSDQTDPSAGDGAAADDNNQEIAIMDDDKTGAATGATANTGKPANTAAPAAAPANPANSGAPASPQAAQGQVVDLDSARAQSRAETLAYVTEVHDLCALAGKPEMAADFIAKNAKIADVRQSLIAARATAGGTGEIAGHVGPEPSGTGAAAIWDRAITKANQAVNLKR
jgi:hypothetical protein